MNLILVGVDIYDLVIYEEMDVMVVFFVECCKGKVIEEDVCKIFKDENYFGIMFVYMGKVYGLVSGVVYFIVDIVCLVF